MKKILAIAASLAVVALSAVNGGETGILSHRNAYVSSESPMWQSEKIGFDEMAEFLDTGLDAKCESHNPICFLFGHHLKTGIACLTSYGEYPECERRYYEVTYCERCGCYGTTLAALDHALISSES